MNEQYNKFREDVFSSMRALAKENEIFSDAQMILGASSATVALSKQDILKLIDTDWIDEIENTLPYLDVVVRTPSVAIQEVEELLPVEMSKYINDRSVKHLSQHTNYILDMTDDDVVPQKLLNVFRDETYLTYENKFVNTLLARLSDFVNKRYVALVGGKGTERKYKLDYNTEFEHFPSEQGGKNSAQIHLSIELTSPLNREISESGVDINEKYQNSIDRIARIRSAINEYCASSFAEKLGNAYIRPPVIRTNAIMKNKNMRECVRLWDYIEQYERIGYSVQNDVTVEMPGDEYIRDLYSTVALQYVNFYNGVSENASNKMISHKQLFDRSAEFSPDIPEEDFNDYKVYDSDYKRMVPISRLVANPPKLSKDEKRIASAINTALEADAILTAKRKAEEEARRRAEAEARYLAEQEELRRAEEEARLMAEEEARILAQKEAERLAAEEAKRLEEEALARELERRQELKAQQQKEYMLEQARLYAIRMSAQNKAAWKYAPEDGDYDGAHPLCPYKWSEYTQFSRKKKKKIKQYMDIVAEYRDAQKRLSAVRKAGEDETVLLCQIEEIVARLPQNEFWLGILQYHIG